MTISSIPSMSVNADTASLPSGKTTSPKKKLGAKRARKLRARNAVKGSIAADQRIEITDRPSVDCVYVGSETSPHGNQLVDPHDVFSDEELADMRVVYVASKVGRVHIWRDERGRWWRSAGYVRIRLREGIRTLVLGLYDGADEHDLWRMNDTIERLKAGRSASPEWVRVTSDWADELTFALVFVSRPYVDPYTTKSNAEKVFVCAEKQCREQIHTVDEYHTLDTLNRSVGQYFKYEIEITKHSHVENAKWQIDIMGGDISEATPGMIASFVNDLNWMAIECANANKKDGER